jgi:hypothetical protein
MACCNLSTMSPAKLEQAVAQGVANAGRSGTVLKRLAAPANDFPLAKGTGPLLKVAVLELGNLRS